MSQDPRHPKSSYDAKYPFNRVRVTESGHEYHFDDTPGRERIRIAHKSGSYSEWSADGRMVDMVVGNYVQYVKGGGTVTSDGNFDIKYGGSFRQNVSGDSHSEVDGTSSQAIEGDVISMVGGDSVSAIRGDSVTGVIGKTTVKIGGQIELKGDVSGIAKIGDTLTVQAGSRVRIEVGGASIDITGESIVATAGGVSATLNGNGFRVEGGDVVHNAKSIGDTHRHSGVQPGGAITDVPV